MRIVRYLVDDERPVGPIVVVVVVVAEVVERTGLVPELGRTDRVSPADLVHSNSHLAVLVGASVHLMMMMMLEGTMTPTRYLDYRWVAHTRPGLVWKVVVRAGCVHWPINLAVNAVTNLVLAVVTVHSPELPLNSVAFP